MKIKIIKIVALLILAGGVTAGGNMLLPVKIFKAVNIEMKPYTWITGTVIGDLDSRIAAEVEGRIELVAEVGDVLNQGDVVAMLDDTQFRMQVEEARAEIIPFEARLEFYGKEVERLEKLASQNNAAKNLLDEVISNRNEMLGELAIRKSRLTQILDKYNRLKILAPFDGIVTERYKTEGEWVDVGDEVIRLINTRKLVVQARIPKTSIDYVRQNDQLKINDGKQEITGSVKTIVPVGDDLSRLYEIRLQFEKENWKVGHAVRVAVPTDFERKVVAVPRDALVIRREGIVIYRINESNVAEVIPVNTGMSNGSLIEVTGGVSAGDSIVVRGNERLRPGQQITIMEELVQP